MPLLAVDAACLTENLQSLDLTTRVQRDTPDLFLQPGVTMKSARIIVTVAVAATLSACASKPQDIEAAYVSPTLYERLSCDRLREEATAVSARAIAASGAQQKKADNDAVAVGVGVVIFWPALFFAKGDGATAAEVARLKGEMKAIEMASLKNNCGIRFEDPSAKPSAKKG